MEHPFCFFVVGVAGLEPAASRSQTAHSSQLSYTPAARRILLPRNEKST